jgi:hypothetical protein
MTNLFGLDLKPLLEKVSEFTQQQKQIIVLLKENNQIQAQNTALLQEIKKTLKEKYA